MTRTCLHTLENTIPADLDHEIILIDDGSSDGSREFLTKYAKNRPHCNALLNETNLGFARSNNRAVDFASGTHLLFLNNDTELTPGWIEPMVDAYRVLSKKKLGIVGNVQRRVSDQKIDHAGVFVNARAKPDHIQIDPVSESPKVQYSERLAVTGACILMPLKLFIEVGKFDTEFQNGGEDMDLNFKVRKAGYSIYVANRSFIWHHVSASPGRNDHHERNTRIVFRKWRDLLLQEGAKQWAIEYAESDERKGTFWSDPLYRNCLFFKKGWKSTTPVEAIDSVEALILEQEQVWEQMFG